MAFYSLDGKDMRGIVEFFEKKDYDKYKCSYCTSYNVLEMLGGEKLILDTRTKKLPEVFEAEDDLVVIHQRVKELMEVFAGLKASYLPIENRPDYFVLLPDRLFLTPPDTRVCVAIDYAGEPFRAIYEKCPKCGLFAEVCFKSGLFHVPEDVVIAAYTLGPKFGGIICSEPLRDYLKKAAIKGLSFSKNFAN